MSLIFFLLSVSQVKKGQEAPVYVINLLISDLIQLFSRIPVDLCRLSQADFTYMRILYVFIMVSVGFMVCISCERYLVVAMPLWYRFRRNIKTYVVVCIVVWLLPLFHPLLGYVIKEHEMAAHFFIVFLLLPFPLFIFFLVGTIKALSGALSVPADEKRRLAAIQVVVLIIYTLLYLPIILLLLYDIKAFKGGLSCIPYAVGYAAGALSPLADTTLYLFVRKSILDTFLASLGCCKISSN
ncbi:G-protein coupled receptor 4-like [Xiphophorus hellerii]|uniref:G-protein coupled receptor 4-like n=1 Tax=Xiphophorus hellerii TaxID=8084 RepID=UPI0013B3750B|nr:G-protein coupled receptor 4-like [Xiphophorus hellerii]XP_032409831.1 G-protein coupled receptor 4-like [Xiphophorus hellerii]